MSEILTLVIRFAVLLAIPFVVDAVVKFVRAKTDESFIATFDEDMRKSIAEALNAVYTAVIYTSQVFVENLKETDKFDKEAQEKALAMAINKANCLISDDSKARLRKLYGDLDIWLEAKIEQTVYEQKH